MVLPPDERLVRDLYLYKKTEKYIRQNSSTTQQDSIRRILSEKSVQNSDRLGQIKLRVRDLVGKARLFAAGDELELNGEEPRSRILRGFSELVVRTYPLLRMLQGISYSENDISRSLRQMQNSMFGADEALTEAETELLSFIQANNRNGIRTTLKAIEERFSRKPYGWYLAAIQCILAKLCGRGKVEVRSDGNLLEDEALERALKNTYGFANVILEPQIEFTAGQVRALKDFFNNYFDRPASANEARLLGKETAEAFKALYGELESLERLSGRYPFLAALSEPMQAIHDLLGKPYTYFLTELRGAEDKLFDNKEAVIDPIRRFMGGANKYHLRRGRRVPAPAGAELQRPDGRWSGPPAGHPGRSGLLPRRANARRQSPGGEPDGGD